MALEGLTADQITEYEKELLERVPESGTIGNGKLSNELDWDDDSLYWDIRNRLIERGILVQGRGRGGSVRRTIIDAGASEESPVQEIPGIATAEEIAARESDLYQPMAEVLRSRWAKEHRLDSLLVEITAAQGSRQTKGKWTRPDITAASYTTFPYVPGRHFDVITFEVKPSNMLDITVVYEALGPAAPQPEPMRCCMSRRSRSIRCKR